MEASHECETHGRDRDWCSLRCHVVCVRLEDAMSDRYERTERDERKLAEESRCIVCGQYVPQYDEFFCGPECENRWHWAGEPV